MSLTRENLIQILEKHGITIAGGTIVLTKTEIWGWSALLDDLLALVPTAPSREALEKIAQGYEIRHVTSKAGYGNQWPREMENALMAWAQGQPATPVWCSHLRWHTDATSREWRLLQTAATFYLVNDEWTRCPICGAPRPVTP